MGNVLKPYQIFIDRSLSAVEYAKENRVLESKTYDALQQQIWSLLPGFCNKTTDLLEAFPGIAKILGSAITDRADLRPEVMASLRKLINQNLEHGMYNCPTTNISS